MLRRVNSGFTIVELLVVIGIIGILVSVVSFSGVTARDDAQITKEEATVKQLNLSLGLYRAATNQFPPGAENCSLCDLRSGATSAAQEDWDDVVAVLAPEYINDAVAVDAWGNPYAYDNNYRVANPLYYTVLCSMGPDGELQTFLTSDLSDYLISAGNPQVQGDDICFFAQ